LLAFGAGVLFAFYLIATRSASQHSDPLKTLVFQCFVGALLLSPQGIVFYSPLQVDMLWLFAGLGLFSVLGHLLTIKAFKLAGASTLAPLVYVELIGTVLIGYFLFSEAPTLVTIAGSTLIVLAGLILIRNGIYYFFERLLNHQRTGLETTRNANFCKADNARDTHPFPAPAHL